MKVVGVLGLLAWIAAAGLAAVPGQISNPWIVAGVAWLFCGAAVLCFFRDAKPRPPDEPGVILAPAHGTIDYIDTTTEDRFLNGSAQRVSIYLSLLDVHVQHAPISGSIELVQHFAGRWSRARRRDASLRNEHLLVGVSSGEGRKLALRLISGIFVRRIVPWITRGQHVLSGERIGLIRFGSRVDVFLPLDAQMLVRPGDKVRGGETILARLR
jgi:phosphatidylserine decarboxylase